jgi:peptide/nickel transport system permease protein
MRPDRMGALGRAVGRRLLCLILTVLLAAIGGAALIRLAPGFGMDERQLDSRLTDDSIRALQAENSGDTNLARYFLRYLAGLCRGELGRSISFSMPVRDLIAERLGLTLKSVAAGAAAAWTIAAALVLATGLARKRLIDLTAAGLTGGLLCLPAAVIALAALHVGLGPVPAIAVVLLPRLFRYMRNATAAIAGRPHVLAARARGIGGVLLQARHIWRPAAPELLALGGISVSMALGAAIPVEALCDSPGVGQLIWKAALARDLPVLVNVTILIAVLTAVANLLADGARAAAGREA